MTDARVDPLSGTRTVMVPDRQARPNLPGGSCPFCPGGIEAPAPYTTRWFPNRWPSLPDGRCEVHLFSPAHDASLASLGPEGVARVLELWATRTEAQGRRPDVAYVLVFENRGADAGATVLHPHGQLYAYAEIPPVPLRELRGDCALCGPSPPELVVVEAGGWRAVAPAASPYPYELLIAPQAHTPDLPAARATFPGAAMVISSAMGALDRLLGAGAPYMLWAHQRPTDGGRWPAAHIHLHVAPVWRAPGVVRYVAAAELGAGVFLNPVPPEDAAAALRPLA
mgnify:CR=1 FL=1